MYIPLVSDPKTRSSTGYISWVGIVGKTICHCFSFDNITLNWYCVCFSHLSWPNLAMSLTLRSLKLDMFGK